MKLPTEGTVENITKKLTEATTDALFVLPAILTAQLWSKVAPVYLYSFEHVGKKNVRGSGFRNGLPIAEKKPTYDAVSNGDELIYLFDAHDIFGNPIQNEEVILSYLLLLLLLTCIVIVIAYENYLLLLFTCIRYGYS